MTRNLALAAVAGGILLLASAFSSAQDNAVLDDLYGRGVHAYFSQNSRRAYELLNDAIENGSRDPRAYYFRGLALRNLGREEDARLDFKEGAKLEALGENVGSRVGVALQRVQGSVRLELEATRKLARLNVRNEQKARAERRYGEMIEAEREVIRRPEGEPAPRRRPPAVLPEAAAPSDDPFADGEAPPPRPAPEPPAAEAQETPPAQPRPAAPAADDPFGETPTPPATEPAPATAPPKPSPPKPADEDPFGDDEPAPAPATEPPAPAPVPAEKPAEEKAHDDADPFADDSAAAPAPAKPIAQEAALVKRGATSSLFRAICRAFVGDDDIASAKLAKPALDIENAADPFADDPVPVATPAPAPATEKPKEAPADPFADDSDPFK